MKNLPRLYVALAVADGRHDTDLRHFSGRWRAHRNGTTNLPKFHGSQPDVASAARRVARRRQSGISKLAPRSACYHMGACRSVPAAVGEAQETQRRWRRVWMMNWKPTDHSRLSSVSSAHLLASEQNSFCRVNLELLRSDIGLMYGLAARRKRFSSICRMWVLH